MYVCARSNMYIFDLMFPKYGNSNEKNLNKYYKPNNKNIKENNAYANINIYHVDKNNNNLFHYLFKEMQQKDGIIEAITTIMNYKGNNNKIYSIEKKKYLFSQPNNEGITPIIFVLQKGYVDILSFIYKYIDYQKYIIPSSNNNLIHCAIEGKNIKCVKKMLSFCNSIDELKFKNKEGYTPILYAKKFEFNLMKKFMEEFEKNMDNQEYKNILLNIKDVDIYDILGKYMVIRNNCYITSNIDSIRSIIKRDYNSIIYNLQIYELNNTILDSYYYNLSCKWNILLAQTQMDQLLNYINDDKSKDNFLYYLKEFSKCFKKALKKEEEEQFFIPDIIFYNKLMFYYKLGNYSSLFESIRYYFNNIYGKSDNEYNYYEYINYVTISFILIEYFIFDNDKNLSHNLLNKLESYLDNNILYRSKYEADENIIKYLNHNEIFNPFNSTWDDAYCLINLMRVLYLLKFKVPFIMNKSKEKLKKDKTKNEIREYLRIFEEKNQNCEREELVNSNRLKGFATINKCYYYYLTNILNKSLKNLNLIKESLYNLNEYKIFYFNTLGIINLKQKKYKLSEYLFKIGIFLFNQANIHNSGEDKIFYNLEYVIKMKYNLCLALFYNKKYYEAYLLFLEIQNNIIIKNNPFFWYRFGLTTLNIYLNNLKKIYQEKEKEKEQYNKENENITINEESSSNNSNSDNNEEENSEEIEKDELFILFEKEFAKQNISSSSDDLNSLNKISNIKRILLPKYCSINKNDLYKEKIDYKHQINNKFKNKANIMEYLLTSIKCFKKCIMLYKRQPFTIQRNSKMINDIQFIMNFYKIENKPISRGKDSFTNFNDLNISQISLFTFSYMNLLFCLSLYEKYGEVLLLIKAFPPKLLENNNDIRNKLNYFKLNAMLNLKKTKEVEEIINNNKESIENEKSTNNIANNEFDCYNTNNYIIEERMNHKSYLLLAEIYLDCRLKKYDKAEKNLNKLIKLINRDKIVEISKYYRQLLLYILSLQNKEQQIVDILKHRWNKIQIREKNKIIDYKNGDKNG